MKQENKELLRYLSMALPYDLQVKTEGDNEPYILLSTHPNKDIALIGIDMDGVYATSKVKIDTIKPYLRPMSSMTEEELVELNCLCYHNISVQDDMLCGYICGIEITDVQVFLLRYHFDFMGLISEGLAIEVTEENNPYNITEE